MTLVLLVIVAAAGYWLVHHQGASADDLAAYEGATIRLDDDGIPTISADSWPAVFEAQGYVVASQRFFHMDLIRRASSGRLAELFGAAAAKVDERRRLEDWAGVAQIAEQHLEDEDRRSIEAYTKGINRFLDEHPYRVGLEYLVLGVEPEPWSVRDTLYIILLMSEQLATAAPDEAIRARWHSLLGDEWFDFLHPVDHPWNQPLFGTPERRGPSLPTKPLPARPIDAAELAAATPDAEEQLAGLYDRDVSGWGASNSWAWCGGGDCYLANDPHLAASVPHLWFMNRLHVSEKDWVVGISIPGAPAVVIGMNPYLAWAFTNVGEDVDDYLEEELSPDGTKYVEAIVDGEKQWAPVRTKKHVIRVKDGESIEVESRHTSRGPIQERPHLEGVYARKWLPLQPGLARPSFQTNHAKTWEEMNEALDDMRVPAQNVLVVDRRGNMGYRASGTGIERRIGGRFPGTAVEDDWLGLAAASSRPRMQIFVREPNPEAPRFIATANERIWVDPYGQKWAEDLRKDRIRTVLAAKERMTREDMEALQLDTVSRYHRLLLAWIAEHATPDSDAKKALVARWRAWDGDAQSDVQTFSDALEAERRVLSITIGRVRRALMNDAELPYRARLDSAWVLTALEEGFGVFGIADDELADRLVDVLAASPPKPYTEDNRWAAQHGFVGRVPVIGDWFRIPETVQRGWSSVPRVERPRFGASTRIVWDLGDPLESTWVTPVGQSGHPFSPHFSDLVERFHGDRRLKVFDDGSSWWFAPRSE